MRDPEPDDYTAYTGQNAWKPENTEGSLYSYVVYDLAGVGPSLAKALSKQEEVLVPAKLPPIFKTGALLGGCNPDWAYIKDIDGEHHVYFVIGTKGGKNGESVLCGAKKLKADYVRKHFEASDLGDDFYYNVCTTYKYEATDTRIIKDEIT